MLFRMLPYFPAVLGQEKTSQGIDLLIYITLSLMVGVGPDMDLDQEFKCSVDPDY